ncbi:DNA primase small subunit-like [Portunus trituberculatus]|uniref:DNA primase small subunit-like n=1 Tax=Portunus trituberculatus TaxID=210409 RepID=UPI001E1CD2AA|nr:DNA primase small subunit-like [Portunus trituberculatus]
MPPSEGYECDMFPDYVAMYYKRIFPYNQYFRWLSYGQDLKQCFQKREFCFTLADDVYVRFLSFKDQEDMEAEIKKRCPHKIDIGAIYNFRPKDHKTVTVFSPRSKELVFDIDMTDYDEIRICCSGAEICNKCWKYMTIAVKVLDLALRQDYGFKHILWVYSGRRGIHCWVCDASARMLSQAARSAVAEYLQVVKGGDDTNKKVTLPFKLHPSIKRAETIAKKYFTEVVLEDQDMLGTPERWKKFLKHIPDQGLQDTLDKLMPQCSNSSQRWNIIQSEVTKAINKGDKKSLKKNLLTEIILQYTYPRLDINVTKGLNHLLKSPFSIHPKTGRVCVCFNPQKADEFNPMNVPLVSQLLDEINAYDGEKSENMEEYKKTSMKECMVLFDSFLASLARENNVQKAEENDKRLEF